jgi:hypothetical protein
LNFRATDFEFRYRFFFIVGIFWLGFGTYALGDINVSVALASRILGPGVGPDSPRLEHSVRLMFALGSFAVALGALIRSWAEAYLHSSVVHDKELHSSRLVADGPYRYVRNPLYLGNILLALGVGLMASRAGFVVLVLGMTLFVYRLILREEAGLLESQGESFRRFRESVPRLLPALRPRVPAGEARPDWVDGFVGETCMWSVAVAEAVFAATLRLAYFWIILGSGFSVYYLQNYLRRPRRSS